MTAPRKKSDRLSWFKMDAGAFLADTNGLPAAHVGIYARLLSLYWTLGATLPDNLTILKRKIGVNTGDDEQALQEVLDEFFPDACHIQLDTQLEEVVENSRMQSEKARVRHHGKASAERKPEARTATHSSVTEPDDSDF